MLNRLQEKKKKNLNLQLKIKIQLPRIYSNNIENQFYRDTEDTQNVFNKIHIKKVNFSKTIYFFRSTYFLKITSLIRGIFSIPPYFTELWYSSQN